MSRAVAGRLYVRHWEPDLSLAEEDDEGGILTGSLKLAQPDVWVHIVATTRALGPRITHGGFTGGLSRAIIDLPVTSAPVRTSLVSSDVHSADSMSAPVRVSDVVSRPDGEPGRRRARRLVLTWHGPRAAADDAGLLATSDRAQKAVRALLAWTAVGRPPGREVGIEDIEDARLRLLEQNRRPRRTALAEEAYCSPESVTRAVKDAGYRGVVEFLRVSDTR